jgi:hypothetical protein
MKNRNSIIARIRALQAKTVTNGCTEAEAMAAATVAARLITEYDVSTTETDIREEGVERAEMSDGNQAHEVRFTANAIAKFCNCQNWRTNFNSSLDKFASTLVFLGTTQDVAMAEWLVGVVKHSMNTEWQKYLQARPSMFDDYGRKIHGRSLRAPFMRAMATRVSTRLRELAAQRKADTEAAAGVSTANALVAVKSSMINQWMADNGIRLGRGKRPSAYRGNAHAEAAGSAAGNGVGFSRPVGGGGPLMIS